MKSNEEDAMMPIPSRSVDGGAHTGSWVRAAVAAGLTIGLLVAGCSAAGPDVSADGRLDYACALAARAQDSGPAQEWTLTPGAADPALNAVAGAAALLGGMTATTLEGHEDLSEAAKVQYAQITRVDSDGIQAGIDNMTAACDRSGLPEGEPDISLPGQVAYACALVADARQAGPPAEWDPLVGDDAEPAIIETLGAAALTGALTATPLPDHADLTEAGQDLYRAATTLDTNGLTDGLNTFGDACDG
ncbi:MULTISPECIES: hypothetical protein [unclassified Pseudactinotalea]|uniref:hypothetical protein n=1 Tax=unclassified Pseudactinotalea TaxID=2649176 RepID=UPI00128DBAAD|nr:MULTISPECIES: hypothetical protein [unclassified Pseudactinotalea]MPV48847.1 hypothetical protein [Pseudactinotalea sp. HY160]QGH68823.1 hypothetical protein GCE65_04415 [Pseudactinotalea sp. HY158]